MTSQGDLTIATRRLADRISYRLEPCLRNHAFDRFGEEIGAVVEGADDRDPRGHRLGLKRRRPG